MTDALPHADGFLLELADDIATLTIDRPSRRNALTHAMWLALPPLLARLATRPDVRALVVTGTGSTFSAGADIAELRDIYTDPDAADAFHTVHVAAEEALAAFPHPTIAAVNGPCIGGGCQLAVACDLRFAHTDATFAIPPARLGVVYPAGPTLRLARLVGPARAKYLLFSASTITPTQAYGWGLVDEVVDGDVRQRARDFAATCAANSPQTLGAAKDTIAAWEAQRDPQLAIAHWERASRTAPDVTEGLSAFLERRPPRFGRQ